MSVFQSLPQIEFATKSPAQIKADIIAAIEAEYGNTTIQPSDPRFLIGNVIAYVVTLLRANIDFAAKQTLLAFATDNYLDYIGNQFLCARLAGNPAAVTARFTLSAVQPSAVVIPAGIRITSDSNILFAVKYAAVINSGSLYVDVLCEATTIGSVGNNYLIGTINTIVDPVAFVGAVTNLDISAAGSDAEADNAYRERIFDAMEQFSNAGSKGAYRYWAKSATTNMIDCHVYKNSPGEVTIVPLMTGGAMPTAAEIAAIYAACDDEKHRPTTDLVHVVPPTQKLFDLSISYYIDSANINSVISIQQNIDAAITEYLNWQTTKINRDINPDELTKRVVTAGAKRVVIAQPTFTIVANTEVPQLNTKSVVFAGLEGA